MLKIPLRSKATVGTLLAVIIVGGGLLSMEAVRSAASSELVDTGDLAHVQWAARLDSQNALVQNRLGFLTQWQSADTATALPYLKRATELNPYVASYWVDLANGCELAGQLECAGNAYEKAVALAPKRPDLIWNLANYALRAGDNEKALDRFAQFLRLVPSQRQQTFALLGRAIQDPMLIWQKVVHPCGDPETELAYLNFYRKQDEQANTAPLWAEIMAEGKSFSASAAIPYVDRLLDAMEFDEAKLTWVDLQAKGIIKGGQQDGELVFNGSFAEKPLNGGFDWRLHDQSYLYLDVAQPASCREGHCLYMNFTVPQNLEYEPVYQIIPVKPHQLYSLSAWVRSQDITSDSGPRLRVVDPECEACINASTSQVVETRPWHKVETTFITGPRTRVIKLSVFRPRSRVFPMEISGEFWMDAVSLRIVGEATASGL
jgi:tetratricopeptide (TPR) repeat protein